MRRLEALIPETLYLLSGDERTDSCNIFYLRGSAGSLQIDAGSTPATTSELLQALDAVGLPHPTSLVITHWHFDHSFGLVSSQGVSTYASKLTIAMLEKVQKWEWSDSKMQERLETGDDIPFCTNCIKRQYPDRSKIAIKVPQIAVDMRRTIDLGSLKVELYAHDSPHTRDSLFAFVPKLKVLVVGDSFGGDLYDMNGGYDPQKLADYTEFIRRIDFSYALPGHGDCFTKNQLLNYLKQLKR